MLSSLDIENLSPLIFLKFTNVYMQITRGQLIVVANGGKIQIARNCVPSQTSSNIVEDESGEGCEGRKKGIGRESKDSKGRAGGTTQRADFINQHDDKDEKDSAKEGH